MVSTDGVNPGHFPLGCVLLDGEAWNLMARAIVGKANWGKKSSRILVLSAE